MRSPLPLLASELRADERTLRRAVSRGAIRCSRPGPRSLQLARGEREYLRAHWPLLADLSRALRTETNVRLAVLYGSMARGDGGPAADLDLLVHLRDDTPRKAAALGRRLNRATGRAVDVARLNTVRERSPLLLLRALDEGRVVLDRDHLWPSLVADRPRLVGAAERQVRDEREEAAAAIADLLEP